MWQDSRIALHLCTEPRTLNPEPYQSPQLLIECYLTNRIVIYLPPLTIAPQKHMTLRNLCVYCGSNSGRIPIYVEQARELACVLVERRIGLVFGGAHVGVMGVIADTVLEAGGVVTGVIPQVQLPAHKSPIHQEFTRWAKP